MWSVGACSDHQRPQQSTLNDPQSTRHPSSMPISSPKTSITSWHLPSPLPRRRSQRGRVLARWFGLKRAGPGATRGDCLATEQIDSLIPAPGQIVLIGGASGSGKSSLLRAVHARVAPARWIDLNRCDLPDRPLVDCFGLLGLERTVGLLNRVGLSEAWTYLRTPAELSDGQRWRLRLAAALQQAESAGDAILVCDEFAAPLDRVTAAVVAHALRRSVDGSLGPGRRAMAAIVVTSHDDLISSLRPDLHVCCDFGSVLLPSRGSPQRRRERRGEIEC